MTRGQPGGNPLGIAGEEQLRLELQGLQHQVAVGRAWVRWLIILAILLILLLVILLVSLYLHRVLQFAPISDLQIAPAPTGPGTAHITYLPLAEGKVEFVRTAPNQTETVTEYAILGNTPEESKKEFTWSGKEAESYTIMVRYRKGLSLVEEKWTPPRAP
jgi:hypothetical protein